MGRAGLWQVDTDNIADNAITAAKIADAANIARSQLITESAVRFPVPFTRCVDTGGEVLNKAGGSGLFKISGSWGFGSALARVIGQTAQDVTITSTLAFDFSMPPNYVANSDFSIIVNGECTTDNAPSVSVKTVDVTVFRLDTDGSQAAALLASSAQAMAEDSFADYTFTVASPTLAAGDLIVASVRTIITEDAPAGSAYATLGRVELQLDIKG